MVTHKNTPKDRKIDVILGIPVDSTPEDVLLKRLLSFIKIKKQFFIVTPNPEIILLAQNDSDLKKALNFADISIPDGTGLIFAASVLNLNLKSRIPGRKFMEHLFELANTHKLKIYLLGGSHAVITGSLARMKKKYPSLVAKGMEGPKLGQDGKPVDGEALEIERKVTSAINSFKPDILFIGFGAPKQEKWFSLNRMHLAVGGAMVVGGSLDVYSGQKSQSPELLNRLGLEWLWRVATEPKRLFRIMNAVLVFPTLIFKEKARQLLG